MKEYATNKNNMALIRALFDGYIFRAIRGGIGYVKCSENQKNKIEKFGITLKEVKK